MRSAPDTLLSATSFPLGGIRPDPDEARSWVERELNRPEYQRSLVERFFAWLGDLWDALTQSALGASPLSTGAAIVVLITLAALVLAIASRVRLDAPAPRRTEEAVVGHGSSPEEHRTAAERALEDGEPARALVESFRALASRSARRGLLQDRPGLTAHEVAVELARVFATRGGDLSDAAALFDRVFYGDQPADAADARAVLQLDDELSRSRPEQAAGRPDTQVPR